MNIDKVVKWLDVQNEIICLKISSTYFRKLESGHSIYYILNPRFYPFLLLRALLLLVNLLRFNSSLYQPYLKIWRKEAFIIQYSFQSLYLKRIYEFCFTLLGLRFFTEDRFEPDSYHKRLSDSEIKFKTEATPLVSIVIPVYNQITYTKTALKSLILNVSKTYTYEVILVNDNSNDATAEILERINGIVNIKNEENIGFLKSCEKGIAIAKGKYICLLNNDTIVLSNWLESMVQTLEEESNVGCVGSKLIYPYGLLQEAGGIIYSDGSGINYGKYQHPKAAKFNFKRAVDYCSGASIVFRKEEFESIGGFDKRYTPAYYEDTDLCFSFRHILGKQVVYLPSSVTVHFEGISSGKKAKKGNVKSYQELNKVKFTDKWKKELASDYPFCSADCAAKKYLPKKTITVIDSYLPFFDRESGSNRLFQLLKLFKEMGYHLIFIPNDGKEVAPYHSILTSKLGIEVVYRFLGKKHFRKQIIQSALHSNILWICRPDLNKKYQFLTAKNPKIKWIYDTVDLHYIRLERASLLVENNKSLINQAIRFKALELLLAKQADITIAITNDEAALLKQEGIKNITVIPNIHIKAYVENFFAPFDKRSGLLFIGGYKHTPNVDAAKWLVEDIMPIVWQTHPHILLTLLGSNPTAEILKLSSERVVVPGYVEDVSVYFNTSKIFVAPLRYGAGMKGKIGQSLSFGLPIVSTSIGTEGMNLVDGINVLKAEEASAFASKIVQLYEDEVLWDTICSNIKDTITPYTPEVVSKQLIKLFAGLSD
jgi:GT2 family glycosyltransferase